VIRSRALLIGVLAAACSPGCGFAMRPVALDATPADWESLSGEWRGHYTITGHDRHGLITFHLQAAEHQAAGDVLMIPERLGQPYGPVSPKDAPGRLLPGTQPQLLSIRFVGAERGMIRGSMDPYWDPDRECLARASFLGSVDGDTIAGSLLSVCEDGVRTLTGRWRVDRRRFGGASRGAVGIPAAPRSGRANSLQDGRIARSVVAMTLLPGRVEGH